MSSGSFPKKNKGMALLSLVFLAFIVLSVFSLVVFSISIRTLNVEIWQSKHYETLRLSYLARSTANAVVEAIRSGDLGSPVSFPINKQGTKYIDGTTAIDIVISGDVAPHLTVKAKAANDNAQSVTVTVKYNTATKKVLQWRDDQ